MWAAQVDEYGSPENIQVRQVPVPKPQHGEVLIKVEAAPINISDLLSINGLYVPKTPPRTLGLEGSGLVVTSGGGDLADTLVNKRVSFFYSGLEGSQGSWGEYTVVEAEETIVLKDDVSYEEGASLIVNPMTAALFMAKIREGGHHGVLQNAAASALGRQLIRWCNKEGIPIVNIVRRQEQADILHSLGATHVLVETQEGFKERLGQACAENNVTVAFDPVSGESTGLLFDAIKDNGAVYVYGALSGKPATVSPMSLISTGKKVQGLWLATWLRSLTQQQREQVGDEVQSLIHDVLKTDYVREFNIKTIHEAVAYYSQNQTAGKVLLRAKYE
jgi:NADPH2:quinone reductase